jgi:hypothetical protein
MRTTSRLLIVLVALALVSQVHAVGAVPVQTGATVAPGVVTADQVTTFLKTLQEAVSLDNRHKVATLFEFPLQAWVDGRTVTVRNATEFQSRYRQILDESFRQSIAAAQTQEALAGPQGMMLDKGRIVCRPVGSKGTLRIVAINEPFTGR